MNAIEEHTSPTIDMSICNLQLNTQLFFGQGLKYHLSVSTRVYFNPMFSVFLVFGSELHSCHPAIPYSTVYNTGIYSEVTRYD
jgi:hypothetical protein